MTDTTKTALITGGAGGLGNAMALALAADGINTAIPEHRQLSSRLPQRFVVRPNPERGAS